MTREEWFHFMDNNEVSTCVFKFLKELPTPEIFFYLFQNRIVHGENIRNFNKIPRLKELNTLREWMDYGRFKSIVAKISLRKPDISNAINILASFSYKEIEEFNLIPFNVIENLDFTKLSLKKIQALIKLYQD